ncbi:MAG TPA: glycosyltransferase [Acidimicrobiales bacterium]|nr:glycosyltransferase [Acidimicrobiales bacterium]
MRPMGGVRGAVERVAPPGSPAHDMLRLGRTVSRESLSVARRARAAWRHNRIASPAEPEYRAWFESHRTTASELVEQIRRATSHPLPIHVRFTVRAGGASPAKVKATLDSLRSQTVGTWSAVVAGSAELPPATDPRVFTSNDTGDDVAAASPLGGSDFVVMLDAGDVVEPDLVYHVTARAWDDPGVDLVHWDDDVFVEGRPANPRFRPGWSPEMLLSANPLDRSFAVRRRRVDQAGGIDLMGDDASTWDFLLRAGFVEGEVARVARVLEHVDERRVIASEVARSVVGAHLERSGRQAEVDCRDNAVHVRWPVGGASVTIVIPTRHNRKMLDVCLPSLARTDHPAFDVVIVDNGGQTSEREAWYEERAASLDLDLRVIWWDEPFNYSAVNNRAAATARGDVLVFLNDDTELVDPRWLQELTGWATQPDIGLVGPVLTGPDDRIQHGGVVLGLRGFADHLFAGMAPGSDSLLGPTSWYRNVLSVTAACVAVRREVFESIGGFDERMVLCGSDVVLGLDCRHLGLRNVCTPATVVRHLESATRGPTIPPADFFASWWRYQRWLRNGDPYFSPNLSLESPEPKLGRPDEPSPLDIVAPIIGRDLTVFRQRSDEAESLLLARLCRADAGLRDRVETSHACAVGRIDVRTVNWFVPDIENPFYGGINTALRIADQLARNHGVENRFVVVSTPNERFFRSAVTAAFPSLAGAPVTFVDGSLEQASAAAPDADVSIATLWLTAFSVAQLTNSRRRFYLIQDFEPMFYPAGTNYALAEQSYRLGLYGLCNTDRLLSLYEDSYGGSGASFMPAVDDTVFHARDRRPVGGDGPVRIFLYSRPGHWRNCWELASLALAEVKKRFGADVHIVTAGSWANEEHLGEGIQHLGLLDYRDTGRLYRTCDIGIALTVSAHPSYLPLELMACGVPVVAFDNPAGDWILHHEENCIRTPQTVEGLVEGLTRLVDDAQLRGQLSERGLADVAARHGDWETALAGVYDALCDPDGGPSGRERAGGAR